MNFEVETCSGYRRLFALAFIASMVLLVGLLGAEFAPVSWLEPGVATRTEMQNSILQNVRLMSAIVASVIALISLPGLMVSVALVWFARRHFRRQAELETALRRRQRFDSLRALRNCSELVAAHPPNDRPLSVSHAPLEIAAAAASARAEAFRDVGGRSGDPPLFPGGDESIHVESETPSRQGSAC
jgi:hypothetical protein